MFNIYFNLSVISLMFHNTNPDIKNILQTFIIFVQFFLYFIKINHDYVNFIHLMNHPRKLLKN